MGTVLVLYIHGGVFETIKHLDRSNSSGKPFLVKVFYIKFKEYSVSDAV